MPNLGWGSPAYVDLGAFERQQDSAAADLAVIRVSGPWPQFVNPGDLVSVCWTVANQGLLAVTNATWQDVVYLSTDPYLSTNAVVIGRATNSTALAPGASYTTSINSSVPTGITGMRYVLVRADATRSLTEPSEQNNVLAADTVLAVSLPVLTLQASAVGTLRQGQWVYYRFDVSTNKTIILNLDALVSSGGTRLFVRYGAPPTLDTYDAIGAVTSHPDQELRIITPLEGTYYVGIYADTLPGGSTSFSLSAGVTTLDIRTAMPGVVGNAGRATIKIDGDNFNPAAQAQLVSTNGTRIEAEEYFQDSGTLFATFDLSTNGAPGLYDLVVVNPGPESVVKSRAVTVQAGGVPDFQTRLVLPGLTRPGRTATIRVEYSNRGKVDLFSPMLTLAGPADCQWQLPGSEEWIPGPRVRFLALSSSGRANILRPRQSEAITVRIQAPFRPGAMNVTLASLGAHTGDGSENIIDWTLRFST